MAVFFTKRGEPPVLTTPLSNYAEGDIVTIPENGIHAEFYVAKHDYASELNGSGRTLLVRKSAYPSIVWNYDYSNVYSSSNINSWLTTTYKSKLSEYVIGLIGSTQFYCAANNGTTSLTTLSKPVFTLSVAEFGKTHSGAASEGSALPIASMLIGIDQWTRSPDITYSLNAIRLLSGGNPSTTAVVNGSNVRPCFTLPATTEFDPNTNAIKE